VRFSSNFSNRIEYLYDDIIYYDMCVPAMLRFEDVRLIRYGAGLGQTYKSYITNGESDVQRLYCYVKATDSLVPCLDLGSLLAPVEDGLGEFIEMSIGPVPARDLLQVEIENYHGFGGLELSIVDLSGRQIGQANLKQGEYQTVIDVRDLKSGMYALQVTGENGSLGWKKFIVQR
jgi:hypothetical protein